MNTHRNVVFATTVYERWIGLTAGRRDPGAGAALPRDRPHRPRHAGDADGQPAGAVLPVRRGGGGASSPQAHRATFTVSAVTAFIALLNSDAMKAADLSSLTKVYTGGAPTPPGVLAEWHERTGVRIQPMYGLTEATSPTHMTPHGARAAGGPAHGRDVGRRAGVQHRRPHRDRRRARRRPARDRRAADHGAADHPGLLAEAGGDGEVAARRRAAHRRRRASSTSRAGSTWSIAPRT